MTVFENGSLVKEYTFDEIRERAELPLVKLRRQQQVSVAANNLIYHVTYM